jgi:hypothetical protein
VTHFITNNVLGLSSVDCQLQQSPFYAPFHVAGEVATTLATGGIGAIRSIGAAVLERVAAQAAARAVISEGLARGPEAINEGIYVIKAARGTYVGQSGNIARRLAEHVASGKFTADEVANAERTLVTGGKTAREIAEQLEIDARGGVKNLINIVNPIGKGRWSLMPSQPYSR